jgi:drug/metabolite transporter (DMT)-like permease
LATHFATWFLSLRLTSVASSTILVSTHPLFVLAFARLIWGQRVARGATSGVVLAVAGAVLVGWGDVRLDPAALAGDLLALLGAVALGGYFLIGQSLRRHLSAVRYSFMVYGAAAVVLMGAAVAHGDSLTDFEPFNWWIFLALAALPTLLGHTLFNWALRYLPAPVVSMSVLGEPIGASFLAWAIWGVIPDTLTVIGGITVLTGMGLFQYWQRAT